MICHDPRIFQLIKLLHNLTYARVLLVNFPCCEPYSVDKWKNASED